MQVTCTYTCTYELYAYCDGTTVCMMWSRLCKPYRYESHATDGNLKYLTIHILSYFYQVSFNYPTIYKMVHIPFK